MLRLRQCFHVVFLSPKPKAVLPKIAWECGVDTYLRVVYTWRVLASRLRMETNLEATM